MANDELQYPDRLVKAEKALLDQRLVARQGDATDAKFVTRLAERHAHRKYLGLALSGGGIRSATFSLGFIQALARAKILRHVDYLSTVSGGSYLGGFLGAYYQRIGSQTEALGLKSQPPKTAAEVEADLPSPRSTAVDWLRENGRYLAPGGAADGWMALAVVLRNLIAVNFVTLTLVLTFFVGLDLLRGAAVKVVWAHFLCRAHVLEQAREHLSGNLVWWSPYLALPALVLALGIAPLGLAYWLVPDDGSPPPAPGAIKSQQIPGPLREVRVWALAALSSLVFLILARVLVFPDFPAAAQGDWTPWMVATAVACWLAVSGWSWVGAARVSAWLLSKALAKGNRQPCNQLLRTQLSRWLRGWLIVFSASLLIAVVDSLGQSLYRHQLFEPSGRFQIGHLIAAISGVAAAARTAQGIVGALGARKKVGVPLQLVALVGALVIVIPLLVVFSAFGHCIVWQGQAPLAAANGVWQGPPITNWHWPALTFGAGLLLSVVFGHVYAFLNDSTISGLYAARLTSAYIGASNPKRINGVELPATDLWPNDVIPLRDYAPHAKGGPLHIINTTLNETIGGRSRVEEKDRKGMNLAIGPGGVSVGATHHATWTDDRTTLTSTDKTYDPHAFRVFPAKIRRWMSSDAEATFAPESLPLGRWMAISGAAASTGLGSMTSLGLSLLCGLLNVRLGHWWRSGVDPGVRRISARRGWLQTLDSLLSLCFPVQSHLYDELVARFRGTDALSWYLTDGGHFENTGAYELIRRRVKIIILVDNGADPERRMADLANLVRKARVDFDTRIEFIDPGTIRFLHPEVASFEETIGTLTELGFGPGDPETTTVKKYAALAKVTYGSDADEPGWLLLVKPGLKGDDSEPVDVRQYKREHDDFPQQTTADQFFDEAQWEAYRKLGEHIGGSLFEATDGKSLARCLGIVG